MGRILLLKRLFMNNSTCSSEFPYLGRMDMLERIIFVTGDCPT